jgi:Uma2 family endonuclease
MTIARSPQIKSPQFSSFAEYLAADPADLPEGRYEYCDGDLVPVMAESGFNDLLANYLFVLMMNAGIPLQLLRPHSCEVEVVGKPRTRLPDLTVLDQAHLALLDRRNTITRDMPPPRLLMEVVSPGDENSANYKRDYQEKAEQYAGIGVLEYWLIDPTRNVILVGTLVDGCYRFRSFRDDEKIISPTFPQFNPTAASVLAANSD